MRHDEHRIRPARRTGDRATTTAMGIALLALGLAATTALVSLALAVAANVPS